MSGDINSAGIGIKATIAFLLNTIADENTFATSKVKLVRGVRTQPWIAKTTICF
jgi:hypothetical protein